MKRDPESRMEGDPSTYNPMTEKEMASLRRDIFAESRANSDIISRMEAAQQRFGRLQLTYISPESERAFDGEDAEEWQEQSERQGVE